MDQAINERFNQLVKKVDILQTTVDRYLEQLNDDRKDISDMKVNLAKLEAQVGGARDDIADQTKVMIKEVKENLQPMPDVVSATIEDKLDKMGKKKKGWFGKL